MTAVRTTSSESATATSPVRRRRFTGLLPHRMLRWRRPIWWQELAMIAIGYFLYTKGRNAVPNQVSIAMRHGWSIQHLQDDLHFNFELSMNHWLAHTEWLAQVMNYYYATLHFIITIWVLLWLFLRRPHVYRGARTVLISTTLLGLLGFYLYPVAPPRLLPGSNYIDTLTKFHTWGSLADPKIAEHSNQFAAMPSLHTAWALWCGLSVFFCARALWLRVLALLYPVFTIVVIMSTGNHYVLDAIGGIIALGLGFAIQRLASGHGAYVPPLDAPDCDLADHPLLVDELPEKLPETVADAQGISSNGP